MIPSFCRKLGWAHPKLCWQAKPFLFSYSSSDLVAVFSVLLLAISSSGSQNGLSLKYRGRTAVGGLFSLPHLEDLNHHPCSFSAPALRVFSEPFRPTGFHYGVLKTFLDLKKIVSPKKKKSQSSPLPLGKLGFHFSHFLSELQSFPLLLSFTHSFIHSICVKSLSAYPKDWE